MSKSQNRQETQMRVAPKIRDEIIGPGVWITCHIGKEKQCVAEVSNIFHAVVEKLWFCSEDRPYLDDDIDIEERICLELEALKVAPSQRPFWSCKTNTQCLIWIRCNPPVDPVQLVLSYLHQVQVSRTSRTRYVQRFTPISASGVASLAGLRDVAEKVIPDGFALWSQGPCTYKIEINFRNHNALDKQKAIDEILIHVPPGNKIQLDNPQLVIIAEIFKNVCGLSVVPEFYPLQKFNPTKIIENLEV